MLKYIGKGMAEMSGVQNKSANTPEYSVKRR
jgi:hypothetical protein